MQISGSNLIESTLKNYFGHTSFLPLQRETIVSTMAGESVLTVAGTGGGKSLIYLLPAVLSSKVTMVVSPLKSTLVRVNLLVIFRYILGQNESRMRVTIVLFL